MLLVSTYLNTSSLHGIGLFSKEKISAGTVIWKSTPYTYIRYTEFEFKKMSESISSESFAQFDKYCAFEGGMYTLCMDDARFVNHSSKRFNTRYDHQTETLYALNDIQAGEEILENYDDVYPDEGKHDY